MHITMITFGSRGDIQPFLALGKGLQRRGHEVRLLTHGTFRTLAEHTGIPFFPLDESTGELFQTTAGQMLLQTQGLRLYHQFARQTRPLIADTLATCWRACRGTEVILSSLHGLPYGASLAEKLRLPLVLACLQPSQLPTGAFADPGFAHTFQPRASSSRWLNYGSHILAHLAFWEIFFPDIDRARRRALGLPPFPIWMPWQALSAQANVLLLGYSPSLLPAPVEWPPRVAVTGYWFLDRDPSWQPPAELKQFLQEGSPPVYIGFGSMSDAQPEQLTPLIIEALERSQQRGVLLTGWGALQQVSHSARVAAIPSIPHDWLFPQMAAVIHHGGAGTTGACLRAGIPSITVSFLPEQAFWGEQVYRRGAGPRPMTRRLLSATLLSQAINQALQNATMRRHAALLGQQIRAEDGIARAVEIFEQVVVQQNITSGSRSN